MSAVFSKHKAKYCAFMLVNLAISGFMGSILDHYSPLENHRGVSVPKQI